MVVKRIFSVLLGIAAILGGLWIIFVGAKPEYPDVSDLPKIEVGGSVPVETETRTRNTVTNEVAISFQLAEHGKTRYRGANKKKIREAMERPTRKRLHVVKDPDPEAFWNFDVYGVDEFDGEKFVAISTPDEKIAGLEETDDFTVYLGYAVIGMGILGILGGTIFPQMLQG